MASTRNILCSALILCALVSYSSAEFVWNSDSLVEGRTPMQEKDLSISVQVLATNMNSTLVNAATSIAVAGHTGLAGGILGVPWYIQQNFRSLAPSFNWNVVAFCTGFGFHAEYAVVMRVTVDNVEEYNYALFSVNP